ncbi:ARM [Seminavis robusta]|uniref:ARM n=1 Tax=Seminavis robusta TaxID=568900 RepID=A0A9N8EYM8_9STRA|nr:ARM [Seminavis robusta]|eukprot:Sro2311_g322840.1 ARM (1055) ;mRNA; f:6653-9817
MDQKEEPETNGPQQQDSLSDALNGASNMLERLWKSHPWQSDVPVEKKPSLGPPPSTGTTKGASTMSMNMNSMWSHPWKSTTTSTSTTAAVKSPEKPSDLSDEISLGEDVILHKQKQQEEEEERERLEKQQMEDAAKKDEEQAESQRVTFKAEKAEAVESVEAPVPPKEEEVATDSTTSSAATTATTTSTSRPPTAQTVQQQPSLDLLDIDFDNPEDAGALKEAIGEEVLGLWESQGLYQDLPEIRQEILISVVETKFNALKEEQKQQRENPPAVMLGQSLSELNAIAEEGEEDEEETDEDTIPPLAPLPRQDKLQPPLAQQPVSQDEPHQQPPLLVQPVISRDDSAGPNTALNDDEIAERASLVVEELEGRLAMVDTSEHAFIEAEGRLGKLPPQDVKIKDIHAFNKYKLHDAVERRVSLIFTGDHHIVEREKNSSEELLLRQNSMPENDISEDLKKEHAGLSRQASMPALLPSSDNNDAPNNVAEFKQRLSTSFSAFDAFVMTKQEQERNGLMPVVSDDEWTEYEEVVEEVVDEEEDIKEDLKALAEDMDATLKQFNSAYLPPRSGGMAAAAATMGKVADEDDAIEEYTVMEETVVDDSEIDVDEISEKLMRDASNKSEAGSTDAAKGTPPRNKVSRTVSKDTSYMEVTVMDDTGHTHRQSMVSKSGVLDPYNNNNGHRHSTRSSGLGAAMEASFPTITTQDLDDDDITQLTFDHTVDGAASMTQDHLIASAYLNRDNKNSNNNNNASSRSNRSRPSLASGKTSPTSKSRVPASPGRQSAVDSQYTDPTGTTMPMDESSMSQRHGEASIASSTAGSSKGAALNKAVAKILRVDIWSPKASLVSSALERLCQAANHGSAQRKNIARLGGVMAIVRAMQMHPTNVAIQVNACEALEHLSVDPDTQAATTEVGGMAAIVQAMQRHPDNQQVQTAACKALAPITAPNKHHGPAITGMSDSDDEDDEPNDGVVKTLVTAMNSHPKDTVIQAKAFGALANLCTDNQERLQELSECGGLTAMTLALQRPWKCKTDQHEAISTLSILLRSLAELDNSQHSC